MIVCALATGSFFMSIDLPEPGLSKNPDLLIFLHHEDYPTRVIKGSAPTASTPSARLASAANVGKNLALFGECRSG